MTNAAKVAPDIRIVHEEVRDVNSRPVLYLQMSGTARGVPMEYMGYFYSGAEGSI